MQDGATSHTARIAQDFLWKKIERRRILKDCNPLGYRFWDAIKRKVWGGETTIQKHCGARTKNTQCLERFVWSSNLEEGHSSIPTPIKGGGEKRMVVLQLLFWMKEDYNEDYEARIDILIYWWSLCLNIAYWLYFAKPVFCVFLDPRATWRSYAISPVSQSVSPSVPHLSQKRL